MLVQVLIHKISNNTIKLTQITGKISSITGAPNISRYGNTTIYGKIILVRRTYLRLKRGNQHKTFLVLSQWYLINGRIQEIDNTSVQP